KVSSSHHFFHLDIRGDLRIVCLGYFHKKEQRAMIVRMQNKGHSVTGLRIGISDARRYFPGGTKAIDLELDDIRIRCDLKASFWHGKPEIDDRRLCAWLEAKFLGQRLPSSPVPVEMVRTGDCYQVHLLPAQQQVPKAGFGLSL